MLNLTSNHDYTLRKTKMFDSIEIRKAFNGFIVILTPEDDEPREFVFDTSRKAMKFIRQYVETKVAAPA